jgi:palmitoyl-protein thioesterase
MLKLKNFVMVKFNQDQMVVPRESEWFGFYKEGQDKELYEMEESVLYKNVDIKSNINNFNLKYFY